MEHTVVCRKATKSDVNKRIILFKTVYIQMNGPEGVSRKSLKIFISKQFPHTVFA